MNKTRLAPEFQFVLVAIDIRDARVDAPFHLVRQAARDQFLAELVNFFLLMVGSSSARIKNPTP